MKSLVYRFNGYRLNASARELHKGGERVPLPPRAFACLLLLVEARERALGRDELIRALWHHGAASDVQLGQLIVQCRRALDDDGQSQWAIRTVPGFGYHWVAATSVDDGDARVEAAPANPIDAAANPPNAAAAATVETTPAPIRTRRTGRLAAVLAVTAVAVLASLLMNRETAAPAPLSGRAIVLPLAAQNTDERWLRLGGMDLVADRLRRSGLVVQPSEQTLGLLRRLDEEHGAKREDGAALREAMPDTLVIEGAIEPRGARWYATAGAGTAAGPRVRVAFDDATPTGALRGAADRLAAALGRVPPPAADTESVAETLQRAQAALLANEPDAAREILRADAQLARDEPRLRLQLAEVDIRAGRLDDARTALDELLARAGDDRVFRARLLAPRGMIAVRSGQYAQAGRFFGDGIASLDEAGDAHGDDQLAGRLHNGRAVSRTSLEDYAGALLDYGIARDRFARAGDEGGVARVDGNIGAMELLRAHPAQAEPYLAAAIARFEALGLVQERIGQLQLLSVSRRAQLKNAAAWEAMDASWTQRARVPSPYSRLSLRLYRTEQLLQQGRHNEAAELLDDPGNDARPADVSEVERIRLLRAELDWRRGHGAAALAALAPTPFAPLASADSDLIRADIELLRSRIARDLAVADAAPDSAAGNAVAGGPSPNARTPLRQTAAANRAWTAGRHDDAARQFEAAFALAQAQGVPLTLLRVADDYVAFLIERQRVADAAAIASQVALWAEEDYDAALTGLRVAHAQGRRDAWQAALATTRRLAGERAIPRELVAPPKTAQVRAP
ncbi:winged helix-turn-helix domain-containing protein [Tahibacter soli]|uniref:Winged helix-turn-helix domain-containing protein n=1 Tax=Tahibacter soli TaxID=2983605 RepID=A0A9X3YPU8_9GAMM|nr:winged helix-turn-helix domain-containing protein [Tahibacter soli]MDC8016179.1 winged helix-turn-helix domain-containing protein [Tahibacter soli]